MPGKPSFLPLMMTISTLRPLRTLSSEHWWLAALFPHFALFSCIMSYIRKGLLNKYEVCTWRETVSDFPPWSHLLEEPPAAKDVQGTWIIFKDVRGIWVSIGIILITILYNILKLFDQGYIHWILFKTISQKCWVMICLIRTWNCRQCNWFCHGHHKSLRIYIQG